MSQYPLRWASSWWYHLREEVFAKELVSIPSQVGILLVAEQRAGRGVYRVRSQYPLRWASSWWLFPIPWIVWGLGWSLNTLSGGHPLGGSGDCSGCSAGRVSIPSQVGILLVGGRRSQKGPTVCLNTLSGGHPLGGLRAPWVT